MPKKKTTSKAGSLTFEEVEAGGVTSYEVKAEGLPKGKSTRLIIDLDTGDRIEHEYLTTPEGTFNASFTERYTAAKRR